MTSRSEIPESLLERAKDVDPALAAWMPVAYPTDAEHERARRARRLREQRQLELRLLGMGDEL